jgi:hypothetical protein
MIGLAPRGRVRPWMIAAAITALQRAFPWGEVSHEQFWGLSSHVFILRGRGALLVSAAFLARCADEAAIAATLGPAVERMARQANPEFWLELT